MTLYNLAGRTVAITGSTGGLGNALAQALRHRGANLALLDLNLEKATKQAESLGNHRVAKGWQVNVRDLDSLEETMQQVADHFGRIDVVIANAGIGTLAPMGILDPAAWERVVDVNLNGVWRTFRAALPHVAETDGYLLATSSMAAFIHNPIQAGYAATKAGVWAMCDSIRVELRHTGVDVGSAHPTWFKTPLTDAAFGDPAGKALSGGSTKGVWKMVPIDTVVADIVRGIEKRSKRIITPRSLIPFAAMPAAAQWFVERIGFPGHAIENASALSTPSGLGN